MMILRILWKLLDSAECLTVINHEHYERIFNRRKNRSEDLEDNNNNISENKNSEIIYND